MKSLSKEILDEQTIKIFNFLHNNGIYLSELKSLLLNLHSPEELLSDIKFREIILDLVKPDEAKTIARILGVYNSSDNTATLYEKIKRVGYRKAQKILTHCFPFLMWQRFKNHTLKTF